ncbi:MAG: chemotaxis-specific protein-glutamate methyltransferase CheB [Clostridiales bacterium]|nr:chemotaxis-specific protein-glutamate methyltransferase CheB [Clostridiales bacterium]
MKKNILIIDDSALMRRLISDIIMSDDRFSIADIARNGLEAFDLITLNPKKYDAILLDINMPKLNGIQLLEQLNKLKLRLKIIMVSTLAKEGAQETIQCLELGAFDFITKPESLIEAKGDVFKHKIITTLEVALSLESKGNQIAAKSVMKPVANVVERRTSNKTTSKVERRPHVVVDKKAKKLVALACSTGGPKALHQVIPKLPKTLDAPMIIVQHMPAGFTNSLAQRLNDMSELTVKEAEHGELLRKGYVYIAKGGSQLRVLKGPEGYTLSVTVEPARNGLKPCADIMYESLVDSDFDDITCVVLTGMGGDGTSGIKQLNEKNNIYVVAQDAATCTVYGMPKVVYESGLVDEVVSLDHVAEAITKNVGC